MRFAFSTASSASGSISFECALTSGDQKNTTAVFSSCQSPLQYADLADGQYQFYVRAQGEEIADSRAFTKVQTGCRDGLAIKPSQLLPMNLLLMHLRFSCFWPHCAAEKILLRVAQRGIVQVQSPCAALQCRAVLNQG